MWTARLAARSGPLQVAVGYSLAASQAHVPYIKQFLKQLHPEGSLQLKYAKWNLHLLAVIVLEFCSF